MKNPGSEVKLLGNDEQQILAREVAADKHVGAGGYYNDSMREVFISGWNAAMQYVEQERQQQAKAVLVQDAMDGRIK